MKPVELRRGMAILVDPGDGGALMLRQLAGTRTTPNGIELILTEMRGYQSERRWAKSRVAKV